MAPSTICPYCGEDAVISDEIDGQMCTECGVVISDHVFEDASDGIFRDAPPSGSMPVGVRGSVLGIKRDLDKESNVHVYSQIGIEEIETTCTSLGQGSAQKEEAVALYKRICDNPDMHVKKRSRLNIRLIGLCCVYVTLRNLDYPITAKEIVALRNLPLNKFLLWLRDLQRYMQIDVPKWSIEQQVTHTLRKGNFSKEIIERTLTLMQICDKCWTTSSKSKDDIIKTAAYFAWLSFQTAKNSTPFKTFCLNNNIGPPRSHASGVLTEITSFLADMAKCIPWVVNFQISKLQFYISDIVKYKSTLMRQASKRSWEETQDDNDCDTLPCKRSKEDEQSKSCDDIDAVIAEKYGNILDETELHPSEFEDEMAQYIKTEEEKKDVEIIKRIGACAKKQQ